MVMVSETSEVFEKVVLLSTGFPDLKDKWLDIDFDFIFLEYKDKMISNDFKI